MIKSILIYSAFLIGLLLFAIRCNNETPTYQPSANEAQTSMTVEEKTEKKAQNREVVAEPANQQINHGDAKNAPSKPEEINSEQNTDTERSKSSSHYLSLSDIIELGKCNSILCVDAFFEGKGWELKNRINNDIYYKHIYGYTTKTTATTLTDEIKITLNSGENDIEYAFTEEDYIALWKKQLERAKIKLSSFNIEGNKKIWLYKDEIKEIVITVEPYRGYKSCKINYRQINNKGYREGDGG